MNYAGIIKNDFAAAPGTCVTFFTQGCPHHCPGCHNPETWDYYGGKEFTIDTLKEILDAIPANGIMRNFCVMGGEPLCPENQFLTKIVVKAVRERYPAIQIYVWTGYYLEDLHKMGDPIRQIFQYIDYLIDGPFELDKRDITLSLRGSSNQSVINIGEMKVF